MKKNTVSITIAYPSFYLYYTWPGYCSVSFTGSDAEKYRNLWNNFSAEKGKKAKEEFENQKKIDLEKIESELLVTKGGFFNKKRNFLQKKIDDLLLKKYEESFWDTHTWIFEFLPSDSVLISKSDGTMIYELISYPH